MRGLRRYQNSLRLMAVLSVVLGTTMVWAEAAPAPAPAPASDPMTQLLNLFKEDVKRADAAQAIINYEAKSDYEASLARREELLTQAPGTVSFVNSSQQLGEWQDWAYPMTADKQLGTPPVDLLGANILDWMRNNTGDAARDAIAEPFSSALKTDVSKIGFGVMANQSTLTGDSLIAAKMQTQSLANGIMVTLYSPTPADLARIALVSPATTSIGHSYDIRIPNEAGKLSKLGILEHETQWRFLDNEPNAQGEWAANLAITPEEGLLRELVHIQALRLYLEQEQYKMAERQEALITSTSMIASKATPAIEGMKGLLSKLEKQIKEAKERADKEEQKAKDEAKKSSKGSSSQENGVYPTPK